MSAAHRQDRNRQKQTETYQPVMRRVRLLIVNHKGTTRWRRKMSNYGSRCTTCVFSPRGVPSFGNIDDWCDGIHQRWSSCCAHTICRRPNAKKNTGARYCVHDYIRLVHRSICFVALSGGYIPGTCMCPTGVLQSSRPDETDRGGPQSLQENNITTRLSLVLLVRRAVSHLFGRMKREEGSGRSKKRSQRVTLQL